MSNDVRSVWGLLECRACKLKVVIVLECDGEKCFRGIEMVIEGCFEVAGGGLGGLVIHGRHGQCDLTQYQ